MKDMSLKACRLRWDQYGLGFDSGYNSHQNQKPPEGMSDDWYQGFCIGQNWRHVEQYAQRRNATQAK